MESSRKGENVKMIKTLKVGQSSKQGKLPKRLIWQKTDLEDTWLDFLKFHKLEKSGYSIFLF